MDKKTLSQYGWVVICILVLAVLIGMATPFGDLVKASVKSTVSEMSKQSKNKLLDAFPESVENLQKRYDFEYYSSLSLAVNDLNNSTRENADANKNNAVAGIYTDDNNIDSVVLLKDTTESSVITISKDSTVNLGGNTLNFDTNASCLNIASGVSATLDGSISGSSIKKNINGTVSYLVTSSGDLTVNGGNYSISGSYINGSSSATCMAFSQKKTSSNISFRDCTISAKNEASGSNCYAYGVQSGGTNMTMDSCTVTAELNSGETVYGIFNKANAKINNSEISAYSGDAIVYGIIAANTLEANNSKFYADSANNSVDGGNIGKAIQAAPSSASTELKNITLNNVTAIGTHSGVGVRTGFNLYITGGKYASCSHGGIYFSNGPYDGMQAGENYVYNATLEYIPVEKFESRYDTSTFYIGNRSSFYIGGGTGTWQSDISVHIDSCKLISDSHAGTLRGTDGETNNKLYISNSKISSGTKIRLDTGGHTLYIGKGNNFTESDVYKQNLGGATSSVVTTDAVYKK